MEGKEQREASKEAWTEAARRWTVVVTAAEGAVERPLLRRCE